MKPNLGTSLALASLSLYSITTSAGLEHFSDSSQHLLTPDQSPSKHDLSPIISKSPLLSFHRALVEHESISNNELSVGKYLVHYLERHNFTVTIQKVPSDDPDRPKKERWNVFAVPDAKKFPLWSTAALSSTSTTSAEHDDGQALPDDDSDNKNAHDKKGIIMLTSHIDTVPPFIPYSLSYPNTSSTSTSSKFNASQIHIAGRGTVDAKACVAAQTHALLSLLNSPPSADLLAHQSNQPLHPSRFALLFVVSEETSGSGMRFFSRSPLHQSILHPESISPSYKAVIFGEPTESALCTGHKGILGFTLSAHGRPAHSGYPWLGRSAISLILPALSLLDTLGSIPESAGGLPRSGKFGNSTLNIGTLTAGLAANVVPASAVARIAVRLAGGTRDGAAEIVRRAVENEQIDPEGRLELSFNEGGYGPVRLDGRVDGFREITVNYGTDVPNLELDQGDEAEDGRRRVKRYLYGPGSILVAHGENEGLSVGELEGSVDGYRRLIEWALTH